MCKEYVRRWSDTTAMSKCFRDMPLELPFSDWDHTKGLGRNLLVNISDDSDNINFLRVPSATSGEGTDRWSIPKFPFNALRYTAYPPENVLVVAESKEGCVDTMPLAYRPGY